MRVLIYSLFLLISCAVAAQTPAKKNNKTKVETGIKKPVVKRPDTVFCDCATARIIQLKNSTNVGPTIAPYGAGKEEIKNPHFRNHFLFEKEHYSAWYKIVAGVSGTLSFTIRPLEKKDDYDFVLYKAADTSFCRNFSKLKDKPLRADICRGDTSIAGTTGLIAEAKHDFEHEGKAPAYVKPIEVQKGDVFYLVLDNVYENGKGHTIEFHIKNELLFNGKVVSTTGAALEAEIIVSDLKGTEISRMKSEAKTGKYYFKADLLQEKTFRFTFLHDSCFTKTRIFTTDSFKQTNDVTVLKQMTKGENFTLKNVNFYGSSAEFLPISTIALEDLYNFMSHKKQVVIQLEGHVNGCDHGEKASQKLSEDRANAIRTWLIKKGIAEERIKAVGYGCSKMLYKNPRTPEEHEANRRVEAKILSF